jgi:hypothetical protein
MDTEELTSASRRLAEQLKPGDLDHTLRGITAAAVEILPDVDLASITVRHADGRLETAAPTDDALCSVDAAQYDLQEGPCYETATNVAHFTAPNLAGDERFPRYGPVALDAGIRAQAGIRLFESPRSHGALNLYSHRPGAFQDLGFLTTLFTHQSAMALAYAREVQDLRDAVATRQLIGQAVGIVMERYGLNDEEAFAFLTRVSQNGNVKLRDVAATMVEGGPHRTRETSTAHSQH